MNAPTPAPKSRPFVLAFLAMAVTTAITLAMPLSARGMYDPKHGRWLQRDPADYFDGDLDVDQDDFAVFQRCISGEDNPADPTCAD